MSAPVPSSSICAEQALQTYTHRREVMFYDTDIGGIVHNLAYLRHIEEARTLMACHQLGMDMQSLSQEQIFPVLTRTEIDYKKPATLGDTLEIEGRLSQIERVRFWVEFNVFRASDKLHLVSCKQALVLVQAPENRPLRLPAIWDNWRQALQAQ